jgi:hypothetical protein
LVVLVGAFGAVLGIVLGVVLGEALGNFRRAIILAIEV